MSYNIHTQTPREKLEQFEEMYLSKKAALSKNSKGREREEKKCDYRTDFQRDRDRITHSKSFRRLMHKTQVFFAPISEHYRTRLTHTLEVSQIARTISKALFLNEDLTEAIALGHDLGHTPFGHTGEHALNEISKDGFVHSRQSVRVVEYLEKNKAGLNLTWEVRDGILNHGTKDTPSTAEGEVVKLADKIAYLAHDIDDAIRAGIISYDLLPKDVTERLGQNNSQIANTLVKSAIVNSMSDNVSVKMGDEEFKAMYKLRKFMFDAVYNDSAAKEEEQKAKALIHYLYCYYTDNPDKMPEEYIDTAKKQSVDRAVCDYISGMSDRYCIELGKELIIPRVWSV